MRVGLIQALGRMSQNPYSPPKSNTSQPGEATPSAAGKLLLILVKGLGAFISMFAFLGCLFSIHTLVDPREAQLSNDVDPFGAPQTVGESSLHLIVWLAILCAGLWLFFRRQSR